MKQLRIAKTKLPVGPIGSVMETIADPENWNCEFTGGVVIELNGVKFRIWTFIPPEGVYMWHERGL